MRHRPITSELFTRNRERLAGLLPRQGLAVVNANDLLPTNADGTLLMQPSSDLFYLTGIEQEESLLLLAPDAFDEKQREILFIRQPNEHLKTWEGHKLSKDDATRISGVKQVKWLSDFPSEFHKLMCEVENVFLNSNEHKRAVVEVETRDARFIRQVQGRYPLHRYQRLARLMHQLRVAKSAEELELIQHACELTGRGFRRLLGFVKPGVNEGEVEAELAHEFIRHHARFAYPPIIASGANSCVLHYNTNDQACRNGDVLLLDVAAGYANYNSDLTRTIPVSGRFTRRQRQVYDAVLRTLRAMIAAAVPGTLHRDWQKQAEALLTEECLRLGLLKPGQVRRQDPDQPAVKKYFMHGLGHVIGLDVHDVGFMNEPFAPGWVLTVEPGLYLPDEGFGIRLENTVVVTADGPRDLMPDIPLEAKEIESLMAG
jgi:Xaa-Pro aminopeptidase